MFKPWVVHQVVFDIEPVVESVADGFAVQLQFEDVSAESSAVSLHREYLSELDAYFMSHERPSARDSAFGVGIQGGIFRQVREVAAQSGDGEVGEEFEDIGLYNAPAVNGETAVVAHISEYSVLFGLEYHSVIFLASM